jgi:hypothetical protein
MDTCEQRFFSLDEAARLLPHVRRQLKQAQEALRELYQDVVLYKRLTTLQQVQGQTLNVDQYETLLADKLARFEEAVQSWIATFKRQGLLLSDVDRGLVEFPYKSRDGREFLLCWAPNEDGVFFFHEAARGLDTVMPITLLPD